MSSGPMSKIVWNLQTLEMGRYMHIHGHACVRLDGSGGVLNIYRGVYVEKFSIHLVIYFCEYTFIF